MKIIEWYLIMLEIIKEMFKLLKYFYSIMLLHFDLYKFIKCPFYLAYTIIIFSTLFIHEKHDDKPQFGRIDRNHDL